MRKSFSALGRHYNDYDQNDTIYLLCCKRVTPLRVNAPTNLCDKNKKVHSATHVLRLSINIVPWVFITVYAGLTKWTGQREQRCWVGGWFKHPFVYFPIFQTESWKWQLSNGSRKNCSGISGIPAAAAVYYKHEIITKEQLWLVFNQEVPNSKVFP